LWISDQMLRELAAGEPFLAECFWGAGPKLYHFPIYYEEILRGFLLKLAMSEILEGDDVQNCGIRKVMDRGNLSLFFGYLNVLCKREEYLSSTQEIVDHPLVEQVTGYIETHLSQEITVEEVAEAVHMSKYHFLRKFKEITGMTVHNFIVNKRIISACQAMAEGKNITESWQQTGFADYSSFLRNFRKIYGISPKEYRENNRSLIISQ
jgi:transcriptional regulator, AraC family